MPHRAKYRRDIRIFISAVSRELGTVRKLVKSSLEAIDYHAVEQAAFPPSYQELLEKLRERIASCDAMIHIVGICYGAEPHSVPEGVPRRSYTQWEYAIARELRKPVYIFLTTPSFPAESREPESDELRALQEQYRMQLMTTGYDYNPTSTPDDLDQKIRSLQLKVEMLEEELLHVDDRVAATNRTIGKWGAAVVLSSMLSVGLIGLFTSGMNRNPDTGKAQLQEMQDEVKQAVIEDILDQLRAARKQIDEPIDVPNLPSESVESADAFQQEPSQHKSSIPDNDRTRGVEVEGLVNSSCLLFFHAWYSVPCKKMQPAIDKLIKDGYPIQAIDVTADPVLSNHFGITILPTIVTVVDNKVISRTSGYMSPEDLKSLAQAVLPVQTSMPNVLQ